MGKGGGEEEELYLTLHCHYQNDDSCIKMGSDVNYLQVSLRKTKFAIRQSPSTTTFEKRGE